MTRLPHENTKIRLRHRAPESKGAVHTACVPKSATVSEFVLVRQTLSKRYVRHFRTHDLSRSADAQPGRACAGR